MEFSGTLMPIYILTIIYITLQLIIGIFLLIKVYKTKLYNLLALASYFLINSLKFLLLVVDGPFIVFQILTFIPDLCLILFTKYTFYRCEKSPFKIITFVFISVKVMDFILNSFIPFTIPMMVELSPDQIPYYYFFISYTASMLLISNLWLAYSSLKYYKTIKTQTIIPWIKKRYQIIGISSLFLSATGPILLFMPWSTEGLENPLGLIVSILVVLVTTIFSVGNFIGWIMPNAIKSRLNKGFSTDKDPNLTEKELMDLIRNQLSENNKK
ncbi:MAG: hypothetical protein KGD67_10470 [Candidatus Lokiarchaeota archaeon]|nr:hypothetical protein [Candidatus Lokiarchaeota archaeon]